MTNAIPDWAGVPPVANTASAVAEVPDWAREPDPVPDWAKPQPFTPDELAVASERVGKQVEAEAQRRAVGAGMESGTEFVSEVVNDPVGAVKAVPQIAFGALAAPGQLAYYAAADAMSHVPVQDKLASGEVVWSNMLREFGGNLEALKRGEQPPVETFLNRVAETNPKLAVVGKVGRDTSALSGLGVVGMLPAGLAKLAAAGFTVDMIRNAPEQFNAYAEEINKPSAEQDAGKLADLRSGIIQTFAFAPLAGTHAAKGVPEAVAREFKYAFDVAEGRTPVAEARPTMARSASYPAEEGAPVPEWAAEEMAKSVPSSEFQVPSQRISTPKVSQGDVARAAEAEATPRAIPQTENVPAAIVAPRRETPPAAAAAVTPPEQSLPVAAGDKFKRRDLRNPYAMFGEFQGDAPSQGIAEGLAADRGDISVFLTNARSGSSYVKMVENTTGETVTIRFADHFAPGGGGFRVTELGSGRESPPDFNIVKNKIYSLDNGKWQQISLDKLRWHLENWLPQKANAPVAGGAAGIKTSLETQSQRAEARAGKSNVAAWQSEEGSALTAQTQSQSPKSVKPETPAPVTEKVGRALPSAATPKAAKAEQQLRPTTKVTKEQRAAAKEFDRLLIEHGLDVGWVKIPELIYDTTLETASGHGTASIKAKIARSKELQAARERAASELDKSLMADVGKPEVRAQLLEKLKVKLEPQLQMNRLAKAVATGKQPINTSDLSVGDVLTIEGEKVRVKDVTPEGDVVLDDGKKFGTQLMSDGTTLFVEDYTLQDVPVEFAAVSPGKQMPKLRAGEKGTGDLLQGEDAPFNLVGEKGVDVERIAREKAQAEANAKANAEFQAKHQQDLIGMGGAVPGEFANEARTATSIKNATVDQERSLRGLPPAMQPARRSFGEVWDMAMSRLDATPETQDRLIAELKARPRAVTDVEDALLLHRQIDLQNRYGKATRELAQAYDDAQRFPDRLEAVESWKAEVQATSDALLELYDINKAVGTETGRGLAARKMAAYEDYTLAQMELAKRAANEGRPLTDAERADVAKLQEKIATTQKAFEDYQAKVELERANRMTDEAIADMQRELKARPTYDARIIKVAEEIVGKLERQAVDASARLKAKFGRTNMGLDPTIVYDLGVVGAAKIARLGLDFTKFSLELVKEFGEGVKPYVQAAWDKANLHLDNEGAKYGDKSPQVKNLLRKRDEGSRRENIIGGLKKGVAEEIPLSLQGDYVRKLAESFVRGGITGREALIDAVHDVLTREIGMKISRRETMDAISGYGQFKPLNPDAIKAQLRDLKGQMQQLAKLEDIQARKPLSKTGVERRTPSDEERRLLQQVNEAKRRFGVVVSDPARQLKSALDAIKTRLKNSIADLEYQINTGERTVKTKTPSPFDAETKLLEARRDELKAQLDELLPRPEITDAQRAQLAQRALERSITDLEQRIAAGDVAVRQHRPTVSTPQLEALRARREALRDEWQALADAADPGRAERASLSALKSRLSQSTAAYQERLARQDFAPRPRREVKLDQEALRLKAVHEMAKAEFHRGLIRDRMARRTIGQKIYAGVKEGLNLPRNILSSWDVSAVLRQGGFIALGNPVRAARSIGPMFRALANERNAVMVEQEILSRPNAPLYKQGKLYLAPLESLHLSAMEEAMMSRLAGKIPGLRASNRAYITFLNKLRADSFDAMLASVQREGGNLTPAELQAIGNYINVATGRGELGRASAAAETLATVFFSPRLVASRFQILAGQPMYRGSYRTRQAVALEYAKFLGGMAVIYGLGALAGATIEPDPRSSDFGKLKFGNTRVDPLGGLSQATVLLSRLASGETITAAGDVRSIRGDAVRYGQSNAADVIARFLRSKLSPVVGNAVDIASGENVVGEPVTPGSVAKGMLVPLSFRDILEAMEDQGMVRGTALGILSLFGFGLQYYEPTKDAAQRVVSQQMQQVRGGSPEWRRELQANTLATMRSNMLANPAYSNNVVQFAIELRAREERQRTNAALLRAVSPR